MKLEFDGIEFRYNEHPLLTGVYVKCETGEITGLLGRNGSGKSTLLKIVFGSLRSDVKSVRVDGQYLSSPSFSNRLVAYLPQESFVPSYLTLQQIAKLYKVREEDILNHFPELSEFLDKKKHMLSGGTIRLFENLITLYSPAPFCFFDEPFSGLAPVIIERLLTCMRIEKQNKGLLVTDHLYRHVTEVADELYVLANGRTYFAKSKEDLIRRGYLADD
ncbi:MAG: ATP-binding cassette domain-containing protein [Cyclobacteriaceae bacterium]